MDTLLYHFQSTDWKRTASDAKATTNVILKLAYFSGSCQIPIREWEASVGVRMRMKFERFRILTSPAFPEWISWMLRAEVGGQNAVCLGKQCEDEVNLMMILVGNCLECEPITQKGDPFEKRFRITHDNLHVKTNDIQQSSILTPPRPAKDNYVCTVL